MNHTRISFHDKVLALNQDLKRGEGKGKKCSLLSLSLFSFPLFPVPVRERGPDVGKESRKTEQRVRTATTAMPADTLTTDSLFLVLTGCTPVSAADQLNSGTS
jgi:hypothetical protein